MASHLSNTTDFLSRSDAIEQAKGLVLKNTEASRMRFCNLPYALAELDNASGCKIYFRFWSGGRLRD